MVEHRSLFMVLQTMDVKDLILKLSEVLRSEEVEGPYMHLNQRLVLIQKWYSPRNIQLKN
jgi:hypothetical protein